MQDRCLPDVRADDAVHTSDVGRSEGVRPYVELELMPGVADREFRFCFDE